MNGLYKTDALITSGSTTSSFVASSGGVLAGIYAPASMTGSSLTLQAASVDASGTPGTFVTIRDQFGSPITITLNAAASFYSLRGVLPFGPDFMRVVSSTSEGSDRSLVLVFQAIV